MDLLFCFKWLELGKQSILHKIKTTDFNVQHYDFAFKILKTLLNSFDRIFWYLNK